MLQAGGLTACTRSRTRKSAKASTHLLLRFRHGTCTSEEDWARSKAGPGRSPYAEMQLYGQSLEGLPAPSSEP